MNGLEIPAIYEHEIDEFYNALDPHEPATNLLKGATTRIIYDLDHSNALSENIHMILLNGCQHIHQRSHEKLISNRS